MLTINVDSATLPTQLPAYQGLTTKLSTMHFAKIGFTEQDAMGRGRINFFQVLDKYEC